LPAPANGPFVDVAPGYGQVGRLSALQGQGQPPAPATEVQELPELTQGFVDGLQGGLYVIDGLFPAGEKLLDAAGANHVVTEFGRRNLDTGMRGEIQPIAFLDSLQLNSPAPSVDGRKNRIELYGDEWPDCLP
jgi:hypothetical protein